MKIGDLVGNLGLISGVGLIIKIEDDDYLVHFPSSDVPTYWCRENDLYAIEKVLDK